MAQSTSPSLPMRGVGAIHVRDGARLGVNGFLIENNSLLGVHATLGGEALLANGTIKGTVGVATREFPGGTNVSVGHGGIIEISNFVSSDADLSGVEIYGSGDLDLFDGEVTRNVIGAHVTVAGYDLHRLQRNILYTDNGVNLDGSALPIPCPSNPLPAEE